MCYMKSRFTHVNIIYIYVQYIYIYTVCTWYTYIISYYYTIHIPGAGLMFSLICITVYIGLWLNFIDYSYTYIIHIGIWCLLIFSYIWISIDVGWGQPQAFLKVPWYVLATSSPHHKWCLASASTCFDGLEHLFKWPKLGNMDPIALLYSQLTQSIHVAIPPLKI